MRRFFSSLAGVVMATAVFSPVAFAQTPAAAPCISLNDAVTTALKSNPSIAIAREAVTRSQAQTAETRAGGRPQVSANAGYTRTKTNEVSFGGQPIQLAPAATTTITGEVDQTIDIFGRIRTGIALGNIQTVIQSLQLSQTQRQVVLDVKNAYFNVLRSVAQRDVAQAAVTVANEQLRIARAGLDAGTLAAFDVRTAEVQVANLNQNLIAATNAIDTAKAVLANTMGLPVTQPFSVQELTPAVTAPNIDVPASIETAYTLRPEVLAATRAIQLQKESVNLAEKDLLPFLNAFAQLSRNLNPGAFGQKDIWSYGLRMTWNIWQGGAVSARVRQRESDVRSAEDTLQQVRLGVGLDVQSAAIAVSDAYQRVSTAQASVGLAEEALRLAQVRFQAGISTSVEVTSAQSDLTQARTNLVNATYDYQTALARFQRATGQQPEITQVASAK